MYALLYAIVQVPLPLVSFWLNTNVFVVGNKTIQSWRVPERYRPEITLVPVPVFTVSASVSMTILVPAATVPVYPITEVAEYV